MACAASTDAVIEIADSGVYTEPISIKLKSGQSLQLRAANRARPVLRVLDWQASYPDSLSISGEFAPTRYSVILMPTTLGSAAACLRNASTAPNESNG